MKENVLITGGTGSIGTRLTEVLQQSNYTVSYLTRDASQQVPESVTLYEWDIRAGKMDEAAIQNADHIIHLAGAGIADERWTESRKEVILKSRTETAKLIKTYLQKYPHHVRTFISASGISRYGLDTGARILHEDDEPADDFVAKVVLAWEEAADEIAALGIRTVKLRLGVVLTETGGALERIAQPIKLYAGAPIGGGDQYVSWVHIDDVCRAFRFAIQKEGFTGAFHVTAPDPATNEELTKAIAKALNKPLILPNVPAFALKLAFGDMANLILGSNRISSQKIQSKDFVFDFKNLENAVADLL